MSSRAQGRAKKQRMMPFAEVRHVLDQTAMRLIRSHRRLIACTRSQELTEQLLAETRRALKKSYQLLAAAKPPTLN